MFADLMSRWIRPARWAASRARRSSRKMRRMRAGDQDAFTTLYRRHQGVQAGLLGANPQGLYQVPE